MKAGTGRRRLSAMKRARELVGKDVGLVDMPPEAAREIIREQSYIVDFEPEKALVALPKLAADIRGPAQAARAARPHGGPDRGQCQAGHAAGRDPAPPLRGGTDDNSKSRPITATRPENRHGPAQGDGEAGHRPSIRRHPTHEGKLMNDQPSELPKAAIQSKILHGKRALVIGIANEHSIAYGCARVFRQLGADLAVTYLNEKARPYVEPLAKELGGIDLRPLRRRDETASSRPSSNRSAKPGAASTSRSIPSRSPRRRTCRGVSSTVPSEGFKVAMDISCHSFIRMARLAEPLMTEGGTLLAMSYHGANKVVPNYNLMGPVKAALESAVRYLAYELGDKHIRVHAVSPGPLKTRAASGLKDFDVLLSEAIERAPIGELVDIDDVGLTAAFLTTPFARRLTGTTTYVDGGLSIMA